MNAPLESIEHIVVLILENRSFDHMLGVLYADQGNRSPGGQPFEGLTGNETNPDGAGHNVTVFKIATHHDLSCPCHVDLRRLREASDETFNSILITNPSNERFDEATQVNE